jgi:coproporphyrinogen III oxidase-like Fe-S oxidoreductase
MNSLGIYISVPFCRAKCTYCNFASGVSSVSAHEQYVARVCGEIRSVRQRLDEALIPEQVDSIYLGGGTPSVLSPALVGELAHTLRQEFAHHTRSRDHPRMCSGAAGRPGAGRHARLGRKPPQLRRAIVGGS